MKKSGCKAVVWTEGVKSLYYIGPTSVGHMTMTQAVCTRIRSPNPVHVPHSM